MPNQDKMDLSSLYPGKVSVLKHYDSIEESQLRLFKIHLDDLERLAKAVEDVPSLAAYRNGKVEELKDQICLLSARRVELKKMIAQFTKEGEK